MAADSTARNLTDRVDALAAALREAGVPPEQSAGLLAAAARAVTNAVLLETLLDERSAAAGRSTAPDGAAHVIQLAA